MERKATQAAAYEDFEPVWKWQLNEDRDILEISTPGFRRDQVTLRTKNSNPVILTVSGEREVNAFKKSRFYKEVPVPQNNYDTSAIQAKFLQGCLYITLPKRKQVPESSGIQTPAAEAPKIEQTLKQTELEEDQSKGAAAAAPRPQEEGQTSWVGDRRCAMAAAAVLAVVVAYVVYIYKSTAG